MSRITPPGQPHPFGHQVPALGQRQKQIENQINATIGQLSFQIYSQQAISHIGIARDTQQAIDKELLRNAAKDAKQDAKTAVLCYFEGIGIIEEGKSE